MTILYRAHLREVQGGANVEAVVLEQDGERRERSMDGVFIATGVVPGSDWLRELPLEFQDGYILADESGCTNVPGLFVAGDLRRKPLRQVSTAVADGANAAASATEWLERRHA